MGAPMTARPTAAPPPVDPSAAQRAAYQYAQTNKKLRESRGRRSMFLTYDDTAGLPRQPDRQSGRRNGTTPILGG